MKDSTLPAETKSEPVDTRRERPVFYSEETADYIIDQFISGLSLHKISQVSGMPSYTTILRWAQENEVFKQRIRRAREIRALHFEEQIVALAEKSQEIHKDYVSGARLSFDAYKWAAEVADQNTYGKKTMVSGDPDKPIQFVISTGFPEPNEFQKPPELDKDGVVKKVVETTGKVVETEEVVEATKDNSHDE